MRLRGIIIGSMICAQVTSAFAMLATSAPQVSIAPPPSRLTKNSAVLKPFAPAVKYTARRRIQANVSADVAKRHRLAAPISPNFESITVAARQARSDGDHAAYLGHVRDLIALAPGHPSVRYSLARALALNGEASAAVAELATLAEQGFGFDPVQDPSFSRLASFSSFSQVGVKLAANRELRGLDVKEVIFLGLRGERTEGVVWVPSLGSFLVGAENGTIYRYNPSSPMSASPYARTGGTILGMRPDPRTGTLLVCVSSHKPGYAFVERRRVYDGLLLAMYPLPGRRPLCNDVAILPDGGFAVTDSNGGNVYRWNGQRLVHLSVGAGLVYPNGIAADAEGDRLFIAHAGGILVHNLKSGVSRALETPGTLVGAIDGMVWHRGSLIALQNVTVPARLLRITPSANQSSARVEVLLSGHQGVSDSTTLAIASEEAFILSLSNKESASAAEPALFRVPLQNKK